MPTQNQLAQQFVKEARQHLRQLAGVNNPQRGYFPARNYTAGGLPRPRSQGLGFDVQYGVEPSDADVQRFIDSMGGNPYVGSRVTAPANAPARKSTTGKPPAAAAQQSPRELLQQLAAEYQAQLDEANSANQQRYQQGFGLLSDVAARNQDRVRNFAVAQEQLNAEQAQEALSNQRAMLAQRGLANSNVLPAFAQRNSRDLALVQQDLREKRDARASEFDTRDVANLVNFIQAKYENGPDPAQFYQLAGQLAQADAFQQAQSQRQAQQPAYRPQAAPQAIPVGGVSPQAALRMQRQMAGMFNPWGQANGYLQAAANPGFFGGVASNRYPTQRTPEEYAAVQNNRNYTRQFMSAPQYRPPLELLPSQRAFV